MLVIADRTRGTGHFNLAAGSLATMVGIGAALSSTIGGTLIQCFGYPVSFLSLATIALIAFAVLWFAVPDTRIETEDIANLPADFESERTTTTDVFAR